MLPQLSSPDSPCPHRTPGRDLSTLPLPPGNFGLPWLGETLHFGRDPHQFVTERRARYGDIFKTHLLGAPTVFLLGDDSNRWIFNGEGDYLENRWNPTTRRLLGGNCTAMLVGEEHARRRRLLMPQFRHSAMAAFAPTFVRIATGHYDRWAAAGEVITLIPANQKLVFELIVALLLGDDPQVDIDFLSRHFRRWTAGLSAVPLNWPWTTYGRALRANKKLRAAIDAIIRRRQVLPEQPPDLLGAILGIRDETGQPLPHDQVVDEMHNQLFAGHDTTVTVMTNLMLQLAQRPDALARARAEVDEAKLCAVPDLEQLKRLPYLNAVLDESMRAVTPVIGSFRVMRRDAAYQGYRIPNGWVVRLEIAGTHENPAVWPDPATFDPQRWLGDEKRPPHSYIPFGGGPRICLGANFAYAEMRVMLALLLRDYEWALEPEQDLTYRHIPFPRPKSGVRVRFGLRTC
ncbi:MAG: cytochrome P450 [Chloroflexota bacterium]|jgi:retinoid hydroxylase